MVHSPQTTTSPTVSILLPTFNRAHLVTQAIDSALGQTYGDLEVVVADDGSTDATARVLLDVSDPRVRVVHLAHRGVSATLNAAFRASRGRYVALLGSDDLWMRDLLAELVPILDTAPHIGLVYGRSQAMDARGHPLPWAIGAPARFPGEMLRSLLYGDHLSPIATLTRREHIEQAGLFDEDLSANEDWDLWIRLAAFCPFHFVDKVLARHRVHPGQLTDSRAPWHSRMLRDRIRVVDKVYQNADLPPDVAAIKGIAYANVYADVGLRCLAAADWRAALRAFRFGVAASPTPALTLARIVYLIAFYRFLRQQSWGARAVEGLARRRHRRATGTLRARRGLSHPEEC